MVKQNMQLPRPFYGVSGHFEVAIPTRRVREPNLRMGRRKKSITEKQKTRKKKKKKKTLV
jgi:hypothetical protein